MHELDNAVQSKFPDQPYTLAGTEGEIAGSVVYSFTLLVGTNEALVHTYSVEDYNSEEAAIAAIIAHLGTL